MIEALIHRLLNRFWMRLDSWRYSQVLNTCAVHGSAYMLTRRKGWACSLCQ